MAINAATLEVLIAKGLSAEDILEVAKAMEAKRDTTGAERQARYREKRNASRNAVTPPNDIYSNPPELTPETTNVVSSSKPKPARKSKLGEPLPEDWQPILTDAAKDIVERWPEGWLESRVSEFRDHAADKARKSKDWQAAFRTWLTKADEWGRQKNGRSNQNFGRNHDTRDGIARALDRRLGLGDPFDGSSTSGGEGYSGSSTPRLADMR